MRQGCPLTPLLFAMATDPLLRNLDVLVQKKALRALPLPHERKFVAQLFVDDNCNIIRNEVQSIETLLKVYEQFCDVSGSRIAPQKMECLRLSYAEDDGTLARFSLKDTGP